MGIIFSRRENEPFLKDFFWVLRMVAFSFLAGFIVCFFLPETNGEAIPAGEQTIEVVSVEKLKEFMKGQPTPVIIDARAHLFYQADHIPGALSLPRKTWPAGKEEILEVIKKSPENTVVIVYCTDINCDDSHVVAAELTGLIKNKTVIFKEGWEGWKDFHQIKD